MTHVEKGLTLAGRYRLDEHIAGGGMGDVWKGTDEVLGRTVAVKILLPTLVAEPGFAQRFRDEARIMATLSHPGVVNVYDYGTDQNVTYLVMEYVEGDALSKTLSRVGRLTPARTMSLVAQAADALQAAHDKGIIHRDVKPANLLVRPNGTLVLTDFGIARAAEGSQLTAVGSVLGTASYISPEQASGHGAGPASDVYALGVVAYQCLAGRRPFEGGSPIEIALQHVDAVPPPLPADIPPAVRSLVDRCLAKSPAARWPSAAALAGAARLAATGQAPHGAQQQVAGGQTTRILAGGGRPVSAAPTSPAQPPGGVVTRPGGAPQQRPAQPQAAFHQGVAGQPQRTGPAYPPQRRPAPQPEPKRGRATVVILGIVLAILVVLLAALVSSAIKKAKCQRTGNCVTSSQHWLGAETAVTASRAAHAAPVVVVRAPAKVKGLPAAPGTGSPGHRRGEVIMLSTKGLNR